MIDFFSGLACGMTLVFVISWRLLQIAKIEIKAREAEVMRVEADLAAERAIPKKRPRGTPIWPARGQA